ncbi:capsular polysaccharide synthesis enzyme Cap5M [Staphylococcus gallinarum]|uniref:Capsular polysaccharide synthesis enzyme Cap5M n=1 Tax=Staphylococcus gallinarum TaxID=1293 RepID=A0A380FDS9_STAGA|nr:capsular polysaccharide synthesis enzyme Cap5M [Staphylococcus gallinarum]
MLKRLFDFSVSLFGLILSAPILIISYFLIATKLGKPVLFRQIRPGKK